MTTSISNPQADSIVAGAKAKAPSRPSALTDAALLAATMTYLPNDPLVKADLASMAVSLEARSPFPDHHVIEVAGSLPENLKLRGLITNCLLKRPRRPAENLKRSQMGFGVPLGHRFRGKMQNFLRETLLSEEGAFARLLTSPRPSGA
jgi:asparagine synthase (glutamine-hydrolysing)